MANFTKTFSGHKIDWNDPDPDQIHGHDIAIGLAHACRFAGQIPKFYSVAQHCCMIYKQVKHLPPEFGLYALLHDASEAYMCDVPSPVKKLLPDYVALEKKLMNAILKAYDFTPTVEVRDVIKIYDARMLKTEAIFFGFEVNKEWGYDNVSVFDIQLDYWSSDTAMHEYTSSIIECLSKLNAYKDPGLELKKAVIKPVNVRVTFNESHIKDGVFYIHEKSGIRVSRYDTCNYTCPNMDDATELAGFLVRRNNVKLITIFK